MQNRSLPLLKPWWRIRHWWNWWKNWSWWREKCM